MNMEAVLGWTVADVEEGDEGDFLLFFENSISVDIFYAYQDYILISGNDDAVDEGFMHLARLDV